MNKTILVTGAGGSAGYNFIDSIKKSPEKITVIGVDINKYHLSISNADIRYLVPSFSNRSNYLKAINKIIKKHNVDLLHVQPDTEVAFVSRNRKHINTTIFFPQDSTISLCHNKMKCIKRLSDLSIPTPKTIFITSVIDIENAFYTLQRKKSMLWLRAIKGAGSKAALPVFTSAEAKFWIEYWQTHKKIGYGDFMISEFLPGKEYAFQSIWKNGKLIVSQARERMEYVFGNLTISGQTSSPAVAKTVHREDVNKIASDAIQGIDKKANGVFCVDLKENVDGKPCVIEINVARFFTTSNFYTHIGCNMPYLYVKLGFNETIPTVKQYNNVVKNAYWIRLIDMGSKLRRQEEIDNIKTI